MPTDRLQNLGDLLARLGNVSPSRVCLDPPPGKATKRDLVRLHADGGKLYELIDRTLVEKLVGSPESFSPWNWPGTSERSSLCTTSDTSTGPTRSSN